MGRKPIILGIVVIILAVLVVVLLAVPRQSSPTIGVRHVWSFRSGNVTTLKFEITNHSTARYVCSPFELQGRNGKVWIRFMGLTPLTSRSLHLDPMGSAFYRVEVTNLAAGSTLRFKINAQPELKGLNGFIRRAELKVGRKVRNVTLNPFDKNSAVFGLPEEVVSEEFVEPEQQ
jgi:hypothetical protein